MCMLGNATKRSVIPRTKAITAYKRVTRHGSGRPATTTYSATSFSSTQFTEDGKRRVDNYRVGHVYSTMVPTKGPGVTAHAGNERGFWAYNRNALQTDLGNTTMIVLLWGVVIDHQYGYRAQHMKILSIRRR